MTLSSLVHMERAETYRRAPDAWIAEAVAIGQRACNEAIVDRDRCTWFVRDIIYPKGFSPKDRPTLRALGPSVYDGTAGVALLLARLDAVEGGESQLRTRALQAFNYADTFDWTGRDPRRRLGFYSGLSGLAWTAHELGMRFHEPRLLARRDRIIDHLLALEPANEYPDMIFGAAGAMPSLCRIHQEDPTCTRALDLADKLAKRLLGLAQWEDDRASWDGARTRGLHTPNLTGFSHGTSGIGWGLAEYSLYRNDSESMSVADAALRYDESSFDPEQGDWRDLRNDFAPDLPLRKRFASVWCHGAPGIGLSRLPFVGRTDSRHPIRRDLEQALEKTSSTLNTWWLNPGADTCVCHGISGNVEIAALLQDALGSNGNALLEEWAGWLVARYGNRNGVDWPTAVATGQSPTLITGAGGAASLLIRAAHPGSLDPLVLPPHPVRP